MLSFFGGKESKFTEKKGKHGSYQSWEAEKNNDNRKYDKILVSFSGINVGKQILASIF